MEDAAAPDQLQLYHGEGMSGYSDYDMFGFSDNMSGYSDKSPATVWTQPATVTTCPATVMATYVWL